jgi:D-xylose reductase
MRMITSVVYYSRCVQRLTFTQAKAIAKKQLADWGIDYFDLYLIHFPVALKYLDPAHKYPAEWFQDEGKIPFRKYRFQVKKELDFADWVQENTPIQETWRAMEELVDEGSVKNIGIR